MIIHTQNQKPFGDTSCNVLTKNYEAKTELMHRCVVMLCPDDPCKVQAWDGVCDSEKIGFVYCPGATSPQTYIQPGKCIDVRLVFMTGEKELPMKCLWLRDANCVPFWFVKKGDQVSYFTDPTETSPFVPVFPIQPVDANPSGQIDVEKGWVYDSDDNCLFYSIETEVDPKTNVKTSNTVYYDGPSMVNIVVPVFPVRPKDDDKLEFQDITPKEFIDVNDSSTSNLSPPADATGALIQVESNGCIRACDDGSSPTNDMGFRLGNGGVFTVGCTPTSPSGDPGALNLLEMISESGFISKITVKYYKKS